ncbi:MAG: DUF805 domain-containing protein [Tannerella sp.]|nr:DUF805 domain-containing protein [Tannerella sp.]
MRQYADFSGRARRKEYWMFALFHSIFLVGAMLLDNASGLAFKGFIYGPLYAIYTLALVIPSLALTVRRLHDTGRSGWAILYSLIPLAGAIIVFVFSVQEGNQGDNKYGRDPKATAWQGLSQRAQQKTAGILFMGAAAVLIIAPLLMIAEIGYGSTFNLPFYISSIVQLIVTFFAGIYLMKGTAKTALWLLLTASAIYLLLNVSDVINILLKTELLESDSMTLLYILQCVGFVLWLVFGALVAALLFMPANRQLVRTTAALTIIFAAISMLCRFSFQFSLASNHISASNILYLVGFILISVAYIVFAGMYPTLQPASQSGSVTAAKPAAMPSATNVSVPPVPAAPPAPPASSPVMFAEDKIKAIKAAVVPFVKWNTQYSGSATYHSCNAQTLLRATEILRDINSISQNVYYVVDTPDGSLGRDRFGFFTEAPIKSNGICLEPDSDKAATVDALSLTAFGDAVKSQSSVAILKSQGQYASFMLEMECGHCGYKSPVETKEGDFERQCYSCGTVNRTRRGKITVMTPFGMAEI